MKFAYSISTSIAFLFLFPFNMRPHWTLYNQPVSTEQLQDRVKRRLEMPNAMAPTPRARQIQVLSWVLSVSLTGYIVLFADFGPEKHCFTPVSK
ncbi:hypothetical protein RMATCC62417_07180 [Rhizopus microsporus]|nr:hypothetical protein RMATCC62417_07180 [Rhizopus microsporus]